MGTKPKNATVIRSSEEYDVIRREKKAKAKQHRGHALQRSGHGIGANATRRNEQKSSDETLALHARAFLDILVEPHMTDQRINAETIITIYLTQKPARGRIDAAIAEFEKKNGDLTLGLRKASTAVARKAIYNAQLIAYYGSPIDDVYSAVKQAHADFMSRRQQSNQRQLVDA